MNSNENLDKIFKELVKKKILYLLEKKELVKLHKLGIEEGFASNEIRIKIYQKLMNFDLEKKILEYENFQIKQKKEIEEKKIKEIFVIEADVNRSFTTSKLDQSSKKKKKNCFKKNLNNIFFKESSIYLLPRI